MKRFLAPAVCDGAKVTSRHWQVGSYHRQEAKTMASRYLELGGAIALIQLSWRDFAPVAVRMHDAKTRLWHIIG